MVWSRWCLRARRAGARSAAAGALAVMLLAGCGAPGPPPPDPAFEARWRDGRAEIDAYRLTVRRYGAAREGHAVLVYVTEPLDARTRVKVDDPASHRGGLLDVLKLNLVRDFQTGIYRYATMLSLFVRAGDLAPVRTSFVATEWCGNVHEEMRVDPGRITRRLSSYFEGESGTEELGVPPGGLLEDELYVRLRGLHRPFLAPGESRRLQLLEGSFRRRLAHRPTRWEAATIARLPDTARVSAPAGDFVTTTYVVTTAAREGRFEVEAAPPGRLVRWEWRSTSARGGEGDERAELTGSRRLPYWRLNRPGDEAWLDSLGLEMPR